MGLYLSRIKKKLSDSEILTTVCFWSILGIITALLVFFYQKAYEFEMAHKKQLLMDSSERYTAYSRAIFDDMKSIARFAESTLKVTGVNEQFIKIMEDILPKFPSIASMRVILDGEEQTSLFLRQSGDSVYIIQDTAYAESEIYLKEHSKITQMSIVEPWYCEEDSDHYGNVSIFLPISDESSDYKGLIGIDVSVTYFYQIIQKETPDDFNLVLLSAEGQVIAANFANTKGLYEHIINLAVEEIVPNLAEIKYREDVLFELDSIFISVPVEDLGSDYWILGILLPISYIHALFSPNIMFFLVFSLILLAVAFFAVFNILSKKRYQDELTKVYNRNYLDQTLSSRLKDAKYHKKNIAILMCDIDKFKSINDKYGHPAGDEVLRCIAAIISDSLRGNEWVARFGGEEFLVCIPNKTLQQAFETAERIRIKVAETKFIVNADTKLDITISLGVASTETVVSYHIKELVELADTNLYIAKSSGRNQTAK